jgi:hypothetical protein
VNFLYPAFLAGALAIAIPVVLHLLRRDVAPEVPFSAVRLLRRTPIEQTRRRRLKDLLLLAARVAALLLLATAFARPYLMSAEGGLPLQIVAVDRSFSMGAPGVFDRALLQARETIDRLARGARVAVIAFDDRADLVALPASASEARAALTGLRPGYGGTRFAPLLARASELAGSEPARLVLVSDRQRAGWEDEEPASVPAGMQIEVRDVAAATANTAVVAVRREAAAVIATLRNGGTGAAAGGVRVLLDGKAVATGSFDLPAGTSAEVSIPYRTPQRGAIAVEIDDPAGYAADNRRYLVLDARARTRVLSVVGDPGASGFYLARALEAAADDPFDVRQRSAASLGSMAATELSNHGAVLLLSTRSLDRRARAALPDFVREGGGLFVSAAADLDPGILASLMDWRDFSAVEQSAAPVALAATDLRHPIFRPFGPLSANLGHVRFTRVWRVRAEGWDVAARFTDGTPALLEKREGKGRVVLFASDVDRRWNDFPLHPSFVPFAVEAVRHITAASDARRDYLVAQAPAGARPEPGVYTASTDGRLVAVNVDVRESTTSTVTPEEFDGMVQRIQVAAEAKSERNAQQTENRQNLWRYGLLLMLGALVAESVVGRR